MQTRCPECHTVFRVTSQQLSVAAGRVRCGECMTVFDARANEVPSPPSRILEEEEQDVGALLREWRAEERRPAAPAPQPVARPSAPSPAAPPPPAAPRPTPPAAVAPAVAHPARPSAPQPPPPTQEAAARRQPEPAAPPRREPIPSTFGRADAIPAALAREETPRHSVLITSAWAVGSALLLLLLAAQYLWLNRFDYSNSPAMRPWLERICAVARCNLPLPHIPSQVRLLRKEVRSHNTRLDALVITGELENTAPFAQAYPDVEITFQDLTGSVVVSRRFTPAEYLLAGDDGTFAPGEVAALRLEVVDPGKQAVGFEFRFL